MRKIDLKKKYDKLVSEIEEMRMFDGRGNNINVYVCDKCGHKFFTRYKDKGVTPFVIRCRDCGQGNASHKTTIHVSQVAENVKIHDWVRPSFGWLDRQRKKENIGIIEHVLQGGLVLDDEL